MVVLYVGTVGVEFDGYKLLYVLFEVYPGVLFVVTVATEFYDTFVGVFWLDVLPEIVWFVTVDNVYDGHLVEL